MRAPASLAVVWMERCGLISVLSPGDLRRISQPAVTKQVRPASPMSEFRTGKEVTKTGVFVYGLEKPTVQILFSPSGIQPTSRAAPGLYCATINHSHQLQTLRQASLLSGGQVCRLDYWPTSGSTLFYL